MNMKKCIIAVILFTTSIFGIEPGELVRLWRTALTNDAAMVELREVLKEYGRESIWEIKSRMNGLELLLMWGNIDSVSGSPKNLTITFRGEMFVTHNGVTRRATEYIENNEALILTPGQEASFSDGFHAYAHLIPVSFKNKRKGFKVIDGFSFSGDERRDVGYVALGDTLTPVSEEEMDMVMENGEWKKFEREDGAQVSPPSREAVQPVVQETPPESVEPPDNIAEDEPSEEKNKANNFWLYALIPLALALLYFIRKKFSGR